MKKLIVANWKMNPSSLAEAGRMLSAFAKITVPKNTEAVVCPPFPYLVAAHKAFHGTRYALGAQNAFWETAGAFTGEVSPAMLRSAGVDYVLIGHSERRKFLGETDEEIAKKVRASLDADLRVILCVGEPAAVRQKGIAAARKFVLKQLGNFFSLPKDDLARLTVAYEPIWAISTMGGKPAGDSPESAGDIAVQIKEFLSLRAKAETGSDGSVRVLYGGSVNSKNAPSFLRESAIDGVLVGGASLHANEFKKILGGGF